MANPLAGPAAATVGQAPLESSIPTCSIPIPRTLLLSCFALGLIVLGGTGAHAGGCPTGNLLEGARTRALEAEGDSQRAVDGQFAPEGSLPSLDSGVLATQSSAFLVVDLGAQLTINAFALQASQNDFYSVEGSVDGAQWFGFWRASPVGSGKGLRTRSARLPRPGDARYLRVRGQGGDRSYAISELQAYCQVPEVWPPHVVTLSEVESPRLRGTTLAAVKSLVALVGMALFVAGMLRPTETRVRRRLLIALSLLSALCWWNLGTFNQGRYLHDWEFYHYYLGSKYFDELGYTRLYACTAVADVEDGLETAVKNRKIRDLATNRIVTTTALIENPNVCKSHFDAGRWESFRQDVGWFRGQVAPSYWARAQLDHGYNATPLWTILGGTLAGIAAPASDRTILALGLIDPLLLVAMWICVYRTFGLQATAAAMIWWGTNQAADFSWIGGAFLRQGWLVLTVFGLCAVRSKRFSVGGFFLTGATLMRIFPGFLIAALVLQAVAGMVHKRRMVLDSAQKRFALGSLAALVLLGGFSLEAGGTSGWRDFAANTRLHLSSHGSNTIGLSPLLAYSHESRLETSGDASQDDPFTNWGAARDQARERRRPIAAMALVGILALVTWAVRRHPPWIVLILGIALIPFTSAQSCYYYSILLGFGLLVNPRRNWIGALLCGLAALSQLSAVVFDGPALMDQRFAALSIAVLACVTGITWIVGKEQPAVN